MHNTQLHMFYIETLNGENHGEIEIPLCNKRIQGETTIQHSNRRVYWHVGLLASRLTQLSSSSTHCSTFCIFSHECMLALCVFILIHSMGYLQSWSLLLSNNNNNTLTNQPTHLSIVGSVQLAYLVIDHPVGPTSRPCLRP